MNIKKLINTENYMIVLDTNVLMRLYDYSPEFSLFALNCLKEIMSYIVIPYTVKIEFLNNYRGGFSRMKYRIENYDNKAIEQIDAFGLKIIKRCEEIEKRHFPDVDDLRSNILASIKKIREHFSDYLDEHSFLEILNDDWMIKDSIFELVKQIITAEQVMDIITPEKIYLICEEGAKRYKDMVPPGFKDAKNKDGIGKYSDLILWKETIHYALKHKRNIIFVTDDLKADWWEQTEDHNTFHPALINEFEKSTKRKIFAFSSFEFFDTVSNDYSIIRSDAVELALSKTVKDYAKAISEKVFDTIQNDLFYSGETYLDDETTYTGASEGIELNDNIFDYSFLSAELIDRDNNMITYLLKYDVTIDGESYDYWGKDDDTKEAILSPANIHTFKGIIDVEVVREIETFADFANDDIFQTAQIVSGSLKQIGFKSCYADDDDFEGAENYCPDCGKPLTFENDGGNGFCSNCAPNH